MSETGKLAQQLKGSRKVLVFTGAGISTGSGIPDFRGPDGLWKRFNPVYFDEFMASREARVRDWQLKAQGWREFSNAQPNPGHKALFEIDQMGCLQTLVTQNIDGLHHKAGHDPEKIIEIHGTARKVQCLKCQALYDPQPFYEEFEASREPPACDKCGGFLKSATISFGQAMPQDKLQAAFEAARRCDVAVSVGSTLEVEPAASVPRLAKESGAFYAIVNKGSTAHDSIADLRLEGDASRLLAEAADHLRKMGSDVES